MEVISEYCDNYFPPDVIEVRNYNNGREVITKTEYRVPHDGVYDRAVVGIWKVKYKTLNPHYYLEGQIGKK